MSATFSYDLFDYSSHVIPQMHPSRLAAIPRLPGMAAASPRECRLLEVNYGDGLHLLAMTCPHSTFVGVGMSVAAIEPGKSMRRRPRLDNLELIAADLLVLHPGAHFRRPCPFAT